MSLSRYDPWGTTTAWRDPFDDFFTSVTPFAGGAGAGILAERGRTQPLLPTMHLDVKETDAGFEVACDAPGLKKEDIDIQFEDNILTVKATRKEEAREETDRWHVNERRWGTTSRSVRLPRTSDPQNVNAKYENGVLRVFVGKRSEAESRKAIRVD